MGDEEDITRPFGAKVCRFYVVGELFCVICAIEFELYRLERCRSPGRQGCVSPGGCD